MSAMAISQAQNDVLEAALRREREQRDKAERNERDARAAVESVRALGEAECAERASDMEREETLLQSETRLRVQHEQRVTKLEQEVSALRQQQKRNGDTSEPSRKRTRRQSEPADRQEPYFVAQGLPTQAELASARRDTQSERLRAERAEHSLDDANARAVSAEAREQQLQQQLQELQSQLATLDTGCSSGTQHSSSQQRSAEAIEDATRRRKEAEERMAALEADAARGRELTGEKERRESLEEELEKERVAAKREGVLREDVHAARAALEAALNYGEDAQQNPSTLTELVRIVASELASFKRRALSAQEQAASATQRCDEAHNELYKERTARAKAEAMAKGASDSATQPSQQTPHQQHDAGWGEDDPSYSTPEDKSWQKLRQEKLAAEAEAKRLEAEVMRLGNLADQAERRLGKGAYDPRRTKVLHMRVNPETKQRTKNASEREEKLRQENESLKKRLEEGQQQGESRTGSAEASVKEAEATVLNQKVSELEKREKRLREVFREQVGTFKDAVSHMLGWKIWLASAPTAGSTEPSVFKLQSMFATSSSEALEFRYHPTEAIGRRAELVWNNFAKSREVKQQAEIFVSRHNCPPGLTSNLLLEEFNKRSMV